MLAVGGARIRLGRERERERKGKRRRLFNNSGRRREGK